MEIIIVIARYKLWTLEMFLALLVIMTDLKHRTGHNINTWQLLLTAKLSGKFHGRSPCIDLSNVVGVVASLTNIRKVALICSWFQYLTPVKQAPHHLNQIIPSCVDKHLPYVDGTHYPNYGIYFWNSFDDGIIVFNGRLDKHYGLHAPVLHRTLSPKATYPIPSLLWKRRRESMPLYWRVLVLKTLIPDAVFVPGTFCSTHSLGWPINIQGAFDMLPEKKKIQQEIINFKNSTSPVRMQIAAKAQGGGWSLCVMWQVINLPQPVLSFETLSDDGSNFF